MNIRLPIVLTIITGKVMERGLSPVGNAEVDEVFKFFIGRISISVPVEGDGPDRRRVREMMVEQYPALANVAPPTDFSDTSVATWLTEQEQRLGGKTLFFHRPS